MDCRSPFLQAEINAKFFLSSLWSQDFLFLLGMHEFPQTPTSSMRMSQFLRAAITNYHELDGLNNHLFSHSSGDLESEIGARRAMVPPNSEEEPSLPLPNFQGLSIILGVLHLQLHSFNLCLYIHMAFFPVCYVSFIYI